MTNEGTLATSCFQQIQALILSGDLRPGEKLKGEYLKAQLGVGLSPIREALAKLAASSLIVAQDKIGFRVSHISIEKIQDVFKSYAKIECLLLGESMEAGDEEWEGAIMAALYRLSKAEARNIKVTYAIWSLRNEEFHNSLVAACRLEGLQKIRNNCLLLKDWYTNLAYKEEGEQLVLASHNEHLQIAELVIARKTEQACAKLYLHLTNGIELLIAKLSKKGFLA